MPRKIILDSHSLKTPYTTRKYAYVWVLIWFILIATTWFSRPLIPYQETMLAAITWEMYETGNYLLPKLNGEWASGALPLIHWIEIIVWRIFGVSELSLRLIVSFFSLGTLLLTASAAYQLWPDQRDLRANAPLILIGSLMWTVFATAHIEQIYFTFFLVLATNFIIRIWRHNENRWWIAYLVTLVLGLFTSGLLFIAYTWPLLVLYACWDRTARRFAWVGSGITLVALTLFWCWGQYIHLNHPEISVSAILGLKSFIAQFNQSLPIYMYFVYFVLAFFPWVFWFNLYRLGKAVKTDSQLKFCLTWFLSLMLVSMLTNAVSLISLYPLFPALSLIIARVYTHLRSSKKDILLIVVTMVIVGVFLIIIPLDHGFYNLPEWTANVSPLWGAGLILFALTLFFNAQETRLLTLALLSVAMILAVNFGIVREATDFYDLSPAGERIAWYQSKEIEVAHDGAYQGHFHFVGRLKKPIYVINGKESFARLVKNSSDARVILYVDEITEQMQKNLEYWQPFRGKYLLIVNIDQYEGVLSAER